MVINNCKYLFDVYVLTYSKRELKFCAKIFLKSIETPDNIKHYYYYLNRHCKFTGDFSI
jgi:hypothetical protein